jgi:hypothetical protein
MTLQFKNISSFFIITICILQVLFLCSENLIDNIQEFRYQNQINKTDQAKQIQMSNKQWDLLENKREIKVNGIFYDVISVKSNLAYKLLVVVEDSFENEFRITFNNLTHSKNAHSLNKKKTPNYLSIIPKITECDLLNIDYLFIEHNPYYLDGNSNKIYLGHFRPPC